MPDIAMCRNSDCPRFDDCYRAQAMPSEWQSYGEFTHDGKKGCSHFWPMNTCKAVKGLNERIPNETR